MSRLSQSFRSSRPIGLVLFPESVRTEGSCEISDYAPLGSYNWVDSRNPTLIIPGQPRIWKSPSLPMLLPQDSGYTFVNQNVWRCPKSPLEPIFHAIQVTQEVLGNKSFILSEQNIDIVTDRSNLRKILQFIKSMRSGPPPAASRNREFRIDARLAPNNRTALFTRFEWQPARIMIDPAQPCYGTAFETAVTEPYPPIQAVDRSKHVELLPCSYHRIASYKMADLRLLVRYEVDAMLSVTSPDDLILGLQEMALEQDREAQVKQFERSTLRYVVSGTLVPQESIMEIKSASKGIKWSDAQPQLYLSQTPALTAGYHTRGRFTRIEPHLVDQSVPLVAAHQRLSDDLPYLVEVLKRMREICQEHGTAGQHIAFFWSGAGGMQAYQINNPEQRHELDKQILESL